MIVMVYVMKVATSQITEQVTRTQGRKWNSMSEVVASPLMRSPSLRETPKAVSPRVIHSLLAFRHT